MFGNDDKVEPIGNADRTYDVKGGTTLRHIANGAVDRAAAELDRSCLQDTMPRGNAVLVGCAHGPRFAQKPFPKPNHGRQRLIFAVPRCGKTVLWIAWRAPRPK